MVVVWVAGGEGIDGDRLATGQGARKRVGCARGSGFSRPAGRSIVKSAHGRRAQPIAVRGPWQHLQFARYTVAPGPGWNGGRDHPSV